MKQSIYRLLGITSVVMMMGVMVSAQLPRPGGGGTRPDVPAVTPPAVPDSVTLPNTSSMTVPSGWENFTMPESWETFTLPEGVPTSAAELEALLASYDLPYEFEWDGSIELTVAPEAYAALVGFGEMYLGIAIAPIYASGTDLAAMTATTRPEVSRATGTVPGLGGLTQASQGATGTVADPTTQISAYFPSEVQAILTQAAALGGTAYWGVMTDGAAVVYAGTCDGENCTVSLDNLQFNITDGSLGAYALYRADVSVGDESQALGVLTSLYPDLGLVGLSGTESETGYAFTATTMSQSSVVVYYAGIFSSGGMTIGYALVGVGEGYAQLVR